MCGDKFLCCSLVMESNQLCKVPLSSSFLRVLESEDVPNVLHYSWSSLEFKTMWKWLGVWVVRVTVRDTTKKPVGAMGNSNLS